jgi:hypothetical protein
MKLSNGQRLYKVRAWHMSASYSALIYPASSSAEAEQMARDKMQREGVPDWRAFNYSASPYSPEQDED